MKRYLNKTGSLCNCGEELRYNHNGYPTCTSKWHSQEPVALSWVEEYAYRSYFQSATIVVDKYIFISNTNEDLEKEIIKKDLDYKLSINAKEVIKLLSMKHFLEYITKMCQTNSNYKTKTKGGTEKRITKNNIRKFLYKIMKWEQSEISRVFTELSIYASNL